ncbi:oligosaccharide flippase family protein [Paraburkholderia mimosarum]|uniref:oligosaccharide flippase family protein n=1 Tax=Paraburkholderia mimosarum TaxID=312026 RepID=UPI00041BF1BE|nr:oligosaccharide flippase family protein [Paraburkholderia mimosarum]
MTTFRKNFTMLMVMQAATYVCPLLTLPWLAKALMPAGYGRLAFVLVFSNYFIILVNYSFAVTSTSRIAVCRHDRHARSVIFWQSMTTQAAITAACLAVLLALVFTVPALAEQRYLLLLGFLMPIGACLTPTWYFQGIEDLSLFSVVVFSGRILTVPAVLLLVHTPHDVALAVGINGVATFITGAASCVYLYMRDEVDFVRVSPFIVIKELVEGANIFVAQAIVDIYVTSNIVILTFMAGPEVAGYFAAGDKLLRACLSLLRPLHSAAFPRVSYLMNKNRDDAFHFLRKMLALELGIVITMSLAIYFSAPLAVTMVYGPAFAPAVDVLRWLSFVPLMAGLSTILGLQIMIPLGMKAHFSSILIASAPLNGVTLVILAHYFGAQGAAATVLLVETSIAIAMLATLLMHRVPLLHGKSSEMQSDFARTQRHGGPL